MNLGTVNEPSETKPNLENCKNCSSKCAYDCTISVHNTAQNSSDNLPCHLQTIIIAQMLSIGGNGRTEIITTRETTTKNAKTNLTTN